MFQNNKNLNQPVKKKTESKSKTPLIILLLPTLFAVLVLVNSLYFEWKKVEPSEDVESAVRVLQRVIKNLHSPPLTKMTQKRGANCPEGLKDQVIGQWPGLDMGCLCSDGKVLPWYSCFLHSNCVFVGKRDPVDIKVWQKNLQYCSSNAQEWQRKSQCTPQETKCASDFCVENTNLCPLNHITCAITTPANAQIEFDLDKLTDNAGHFWVGDIATNVTSFNELCYDRFEHTAVGDIENRRPVVDFELSTAKGIICLDPRFAAVADLTIYPLEVQKAVGCNKFGQVQTNANTKTLVTGFAPWTMVNQMQVSNTYQSTINEIPRWSNYVRTNYEVYLNAVHRFEIGPQAGCKDFDLQKFEYVVSWSNYSRKVLHTLVWVVFSLCIVVAVLALIMVAALLSSQMANRESTKLSIAKWYIFTSFVLALFAFCTCLWFFLHVVNTMGNLNTELQKFNADNCIVEPQGVKLAIYEIANYDEWATRAVKPYMWWILHSSWIYLLIWSILWKTWNKQQIIIE